MNISLKKDFDIIVLGAGIVGVSTALYLQEKGKKVLLIDKSGAGLETSYGNSGIISSSYSLPFAAPSLKDSIKMFLGQLTAARVSYPSGIKQMPWMLKLYIQSFSNSRLSNGKKISPLIKHALKEHKKLISGTGFEELLKTNGKINLYRSASSLEGCKLNHKLITELGGSYETLSPQEVIEIEPTIKPNFYKAIRWNGSARLTDPGAAVKAYADKFVKNGGIFKIGKVEKLIKFGGNWQIITQDKTIKADSIVLCTGPWANELLKPFNIKLPIGIKRGYHKHFKLLEGSLSYAFADADTGYLIVPTPQGIRITTGAEFASIYAPNNPIQLKQSLEKAKELLPLGDAIEKTAWVGSRPCTADSLPIIDEVKKHKGLWLNLGHGHIGMTIGPVSGRLIAEKIIGEKTLCDSQPYSLERFGL